jgi:hypothetical protein
MNIEQKSFSLITVSEATRILNVQGTWLSISDGGGGIFLKLEITMQS